MALRLIGITESVSLDPMAMGDPGYPAEKCPRVKGGPIKEPAREGWE